MELSFQTADFKEGVAHFQARAVTSNARGVSCTISRGS